MLSILKRFFSSQKDEEIGQEDLEEEFENRFGFELYLIEDVQFRKEVLVTLMMKYREAEQLAYNKQPSGKGDQVRKYRMAMRLYGFAVRVARISHPDFKELPLHWTGLPAFIKSWQTKNNCSWVDVEVKTAKLKK